VFVGISTRPIHSRRKNAVHRGKRPGALPLHQAPGPADGPRAAHAEQLKGRSRTLYSRRLVDFDHAVHAYRRELGRVRGPRKPHHRSLVVGEGASRRNGGLPLEVTHFHLVGAEREVLGSGQR